jgi:hypothetical protein
MSRWRQAAAALFLILAAASCDSSGQAKSAHASKSDQKELTSAARIFSGVADGFDRESNECVRISVTKSAMSQCFVHVFKVVDATVKRVDRMVAQIAPTVSGACHNSIIRYQAESKVMHSKLDELGAAPSLPVAKQVGDETPTYRHAISNLEDTCYGS